MAGCTTTALARLVQQATFGPEPTVSTQAMKEALDANKRAYLLVCRYEVFTLPC